MRAYYEIKDGLVVATTAERATIDVFSAPDEIEKGYLVETIGLDRHDLESALDPDEISRVEFTPEYTFIVFKRPDNVTTDQQVRFGVSTVGFVLRENKLTIVLGAGEIPFSDREFQKVSTLNGVILRFFLNIVRHYFGHLKAIKMINADLQAKLSTAMENKYLLQMFALGESLIYYLNAIEENSAVLGKIRSGPAKMGLTDDHIEMMDDIIIEHQQCLRQTQIFSSVLSGLMDARGNLINNNMNVLLRNLTLINVVFLPLNLIASIGGMSEFSSFTNGIDWRFSYFLFAVAMFIIGWATWIYLNRRIEKPRATHRRPRWAWQRRRK
jgi:magnesium transporter